MTSPARLDALGDTVGALEERRDRRQATGDLQGYRGRRAAFAEEKFGTLTPAQAEHLGLVDVHPRVAAYGGNGLGMSYATAMLVLYEIFVEGALVIVTAPTERQLRDVLMRDVRQLWQRVPSLDGELHMMGLRRADHPLSGLTCIPASETNRLRGFHAPRMVFLIEEAQGVPAFAFDVAEMLAVGEHDRVVLSGNCDMGASGPFYRRCMTWPSVRYDADEHPNVREGRTIIAGGPTLASRAQRVADYGESSSFFQASWRGQFLEAVGAALFSHEAVEAAVGRWHQCARLASGVSARLTLDPRRPTVTHLSLDPARLGPDASVLAVRCGDTVEQLLVWGQLRTTDSARRVVAEMERLGVPLDIGIVVDEPGMGGGVVDALIDLGVRVRPYNGVRPPTRRGQETYANCRAECYGHLQARLDRGTIALPPDDLLVEELCALRWRPGPEGAPLELETKDEIRARLGRSPDRADAIAMALTDDGYARLIA
jgi:phage terminase large subunit